ncbi:MAG: tetratricopeptide repeat protein [Acidobacteriota bacterium]|nr:tetratricopeptide repeat protein [Acidobacteriota bacterium]
MNFGDLLVGLGRTSEAIAQYEKAATLAPDFMDAHY